MGRRTGTEDAVRRLRPWVPALWAVVVGYAGYFGTGGEGAWGVVFSALMVLGGVVLVVDGVRELLRQRRIRRR